MVLYPLSAFRAMTRPALKVYRRSAATAPEERASTDADAQGVVNDYLEYHAYEQKLDTLFRRDKAGTLNGSVPFSW